MASYRELILLNTPAWLKDPVGTAWQSVQGAFMDAVHASALAAMQAAYPSLAPLDALPFVGDMRDLDRGPTEDDVTWRARLGKPFSAWTAAGSDPGILSQLALLGYSGVTILHNWDWDFDGAGNDEPYCYRQWVVLVDGTISPDGTWGSGGSYDDGGTWDSTATIDQVDRIRRSVVKWRASHAETWILIYASAPELWDFPAGEWDSDGDYPTSTPSTAFVTWYV